MSYIVSVLYYMFLVFYFIVLVRIAFSDEICSKYKYKAKHIKESISANPQ